MIRHPFLILAELACAALVALLGHLGLDRPLPQPKALEFALTAIGEQELADGSWSGVDLLREPQRHVDRFQLTVLPESEAQLTVDVVEPDGSARRIFPNAGQDGRVAPGKLYALPSPRGFYELDGAARLRVTVSAPGATRPTLANPLPGGEISRTYPLSDGTHFRALERAFGAPAAGIVELDLQR